MEFNLPQIHEAIADAFPDRECIVFRDVRITWGEFTSRSRKFANYLLAQGITRRRSRENLSPFQSGQDHIGLYLHNGNEYLEATLGAMKAGAVAVNINYRYVDHEIEYLLQDSACVGLVFHSVFAPTVERIVSRLPRLTTLIQVQDSSDNRLLPDAIWYEDALAAAAASRPEMDWRPDDLYLLYTGGTTGAPKAVLWRQADIFVAALGGRRADGVEFGSLAEIVERASLGGNVRTLASPPFMHGAALWAAFSAWHRGGTVVIQSEPEHFSAADVLSSAERHRATHLSIVGDSFAIPLLDELARRSYDLEALRTVITGGAAMRPATRARMAKALPGVRIVDIMGSSEAGGQGQRVAGRSVDGAVVYRPSGNTVVLSPDLSRVLPPSCGELGWLATGGPVPLGYLNDREKSRRSFVEIDGTRYAVPGDRARWHDGRNIEVVGRDSGTINTGGEKVFAEEVERALRQNSLVHDVVVVGRPSKRWGEEVVAIVQPQVGANVSEDDLISECRGLLASFKLPKRVIFVETVVRSPHGKPDYGWASEIARDGSA